jgi:tRNA A37 methylthiotransferase MiaB
MDESDADKASQYLVDTALPYGRARARVAKAEAMLRHIKALAMKASGENAVSAQEREAYASDTYRLAIDELFDATTEAEQMKAAREAAVVRVDFWRSVNARQRGA